MTDRPGVPPTIDGLARAMARDLMQEVIDDSRRDAARLVGQMLTEALVREMTSTLSECETAQPGIAKARGDQVAAEPPGPGPVTEARERPSGESGWYVYGITWEEVARVLRRRPGIDGAEIDSVPVGRVAAIVSPVAADGQWGFDPEGNLDMEALAPRAREHERILEEVLERGPVLPLRFGVMYPAVEDVRRVLADEGAALQAELDRLSAHSEWGITIRAEAAVALAAVPDISEAGRGYLDRRRREREATERQRAAGRRVREEIHTRLMAVSTAAAVLPVPDGERSCLLRASYLVPDQGVPAFREAAEAALAEAPGDLRLMGDLTGPWPPYHFTRIRLGEVVSA